MHLDMQQLSRVVSHALRHEPWLYELELDDEGWTTTESVLIALKNRNSKWADLTEADLERMIEGSSKRRHEIRNGRVSALYGHSLSGKLKKIQATPPGLLFHGTDPKVVPQIMEVGLQPMNRQYVHLSIDVATAREVGLRKSKQPEILQVQALKAHSAGVHFYEGNEMVWLADHVPAEFISLDANPNP